MVKRPIVFSHERSGTHFLMNTLKMNFGFIAVPWIDFDWVVNPYAPENIKEGFQTLLLDDELNIVKSHHEFGFFEDIIDFLTKNYHVFYMHRKTDQVMKSFCKHLNELQWDAGPKCANEDTFETLAPAGAMMRYQKKQHPTMKQRHINHVNGWCGRKDIIYIRYDDLNKNFDRTVREIGKKIGKSVLTPLRPSKLENVITPVIDEDSVRASLGSLR